MICDTAYFPQLCWRQRQSKKTEKSLRDRSRCANCPVPENNSCLRALDCLQFPNRSSTASNLTFRALEKPMNEGVKKHDNCQTLPLT